MLVCHVFVLVVGGFIFMGFSCLVLLFGGRVFRVHSGGSLGVFFR